MNQRQSSKANVTSSRWSAYAVAGAAAAFVGANSADADIVHEVFDPALAIGNNVNDVSISRSSVGLAFEVNNFQSLPFFEATEFYMAFNVGSWASVLTPTKTGQSFLLPANLAEGTEITTWSGFRNGNGSLAYYSSSFFPDGKGNFRGVDGYVGFRFSGGDLHGWAHFTSLGGTAFTLDEIAYTTTPGETIRAGQTSSIPEPTSLGLFALGAVGLLASRRQKV